jgi:hypothetical protein
METVQKYMHRIAHAYGSDRVIWKGMVTIVLICTFLVVALSWYQYLWVIDETVVIQPSKSLRTGLTVQDVEEIEINHQKRVGEYEKLLLQQEEQNIITKQKDAKK